MSYTPVGLYAGSLSRPRLMPETSVIPAYSKFGDRNFAPNGAKREGKPRFSGATLRAHAVVSPLKFSAESRYIFSPKKCNETPYNPSVCCADSFPQGKPSVAPKWDLLFCAPPTVGCVTSLCPPQTPNSSLLTSKATPHNSRLTA